MRKLKEYDISFAGLKQGKHQFLYQIDHSFLDLFPFDELNDIHQIVTVDLEKKTNLLELHFHNKGTVNVNCDVSNEPFDLPVEGSLFLVVKFGEEYNDDDELSEEERTFLKNFRKTFINAKITEEIGDKWNFNEGCLSIPGIREDVSRQKQITIEYDDEDFNHHTLTVGGLAARIIQHEYDHIEGILFTDKLSSFKKQLIKNKLANISKGKVKVDYRMKFPDVKGRQ